MPRYQLPLALILLASMLAGCSGQQDASPIGTTTETDAPGAPSNMTEAPFVNPWSLIECRFVVAEVPVDAEAMQARLPPGFNVSRRGFAPYLGVEFFQCERGAGLGNEEVSPLDYAGLFTSVTPIDAYLVEGIDSYFVGWDTLVPDAPRRDRLLELGLPVHDGSVRMMQALDAVPVIHAEVELDGFGAIVLDGVFPQAGQPFNIRFMTYMPTSDGRLATWAATIDAQSVGYGQGIIEFPPNTWPAELLGAERVQTDLLAGTWSFVDGTITGPG